jgi:hypothetical protein
MLLPSAQVTTVTSRKTLSRDVTRDYTHSNINKNDFQDFEIKSVNNNSDEKYIFFKSGLVNNDSKMNKLNIIGTNNNNLNIYQKIYRSLNSGNNLRKNEKQFINNNSINNNINNSNYNNSNNNSINNKNNNNKNNNNKNNNNNNNNNNLSEEKEQETFVNKKKIAPNNKKKKKKFDRFANVFWPSQESGVFICFILCVGVGIGTSFLFFFHCYLGFFSKNIITIVIIVIITIIIIN